MTHSRNLEILVGVFVAAGIAALFMLSMKVSNLSTFSSDDGYTINVRFNNIGGLKVRAPVTMAGVRVGRVSEIGFDVHTYEAVVSLNISGEYNILPRDTAATIYTAGLLGEQYISLDPGGDEKYLKDGDEIKLSSDALILEQMIGQFLFSKAAEGDNKDK
jgi:phospholipid/cholesterol/gamma-HCH transport system substrate-binding protein